jgi:DNA-binding response OmpR family regulator
MLRQPGFEVREAATGAEALHLALEKPEPILIDFAPSDKSGLEFCYQIKASPATASIPILPLFLGAVESGGQVPGPGEAGDSALAAAVEPRALIAAIETFLRVRVTEKKFQPPAPAPIRAASSSSICTSWLESTRSGSRAGRPTLRWLRPRPGAS